MTSLRIMMLLVALVVCYLLFLRTQPSVNSRRDESALLSADPAKAAAAHSQYKEAMDKAHAAAKQMQDQRSEADSL